MNTANPDAANLIQFLKAGSFVDDRGQRLIGKYLMGGAALGGSAALATSLMNYLATLKQQGDEATDTSKDDDVLYLTLKNKNSNAPKVTKTPGAKYASINGGLALTGGALATLGTYAAVRSLYQKYKKKQLQSELDDAQQQFFDVVSQEGAASKRAGEKSAIVEREGDEWLLYTKDKSRVLGRHKTPKAAYAQEYAIQKSQEREAAKEAAMNPEGKPMGFTELLTSAPVTMTLLAALASGALAHKALDRTFPRPKVNSTVGPKRVVIKKEKSYDDTEDEIPSPDASKMANYHGLSDSEVFEDGLEFLVHTVLANTKVANVSDLRTICGAVAAGQKDTFVHNLMEYGFDTAVNLIKGAEEHYPTDRAKQALVVGQVVKSAELAPIIGVLAASEYEDMAPHFMKAAKERSEAEKVTLCKIAGVIGAFGRNQIFSASDVFAKESAMAHAGHTHVSPEIAQLLAQLVAQVKQNPQGSLGEVKADDEDPDLNLMTTESESSAGSEEGTHNESQDKKPAIEDHTTNKKRHAPKEAPIRDGIDKVLVGAGQLA